LKQRFFFKKNFINLDDSILCAPQPPIAPSRALPDQTCWWKICGLNWKNIADILIC
jgi:hypothetical protein